MVILSTQDTDDRVNLEKDEKLCKLLNSASYKIKAICKQEKLLASDYSPCPYYYSDIISGSSNPFFEEMIFSLSNLWNCCCCFQLFPTVLNDEEKLSILQVSSSLEQISTGTITGIRDEIAIRPLKQYQYYRERLNAPLFLYNILVFGENNKSANIITARIKSILHNGKDNYFPDIVSYDISKKEVNLVSQFAYYPWNINKYIQNYCGDPAIRRAVSISNGVKRLFNIVSSEEASTFFKFPIYQEKLLALPYHNEVGNLNRFSEKVTDENNLLIGYSFFDQTLRIGATKKAFTKHALIVGTPGTGKTTFCINLLLQFSIKGIPFLAIEPTKCEYRALIDAIPDVQIFTPGNSDISPFIINPFIPPKDIKLEQYIPGLISAFGVAFDMVHPLDMIFLRAIRDCYNEHGWKDYSCVGDSDVELFGLYEFVLTFKRIVSKSKYASDIKGNIESGGTFRLLNLIEQNANIYDNIHTIPIEDLLKQKTIIELNAIENSNQKALLMALLLMNICIYTKHNTKGDGKLKNVLLLDEAHVLLDAGGGNQYENDDKRLNTRSALQNMVAEVRSFGTSIIIADQSPTKVSREIVANTEIKVVFRLVEKNERSLISDSISMKDEQKEYLSKLKEGMAYVYYSELESPQLVITKDIRKEKNIRLSIPDEEIKVHGTYWDANKILLRPYKECDLCENCETGCSFRIRAYASYLSQKAVLKYQDSIEKKEDLFKYIYSLDRLMRDTLIEDINGSDYIRLVFCMKIEFYRKYCLINDFTLSDESLKKAISAVCQNK